MRTASGIGLATVSGDTVLDAWYPSPTLGTRHKPVTLIQSDDLARRVSTVVVERTIDLDAAPADEPDAYLRLHLLSHRLVLPNEVNLEGLFGILANVVWTDRGPCLATDFESTRVRLHGSGYVSVTSVDRLPRMTDYVVPNGIRIGDANRVRLGAYLAPGTVVMHEGFVNYNAGTLGRTMVEGRISQGVVVGEDTDIGGGASIMGTLSGGNQERVSVGRGCLIGANAGIGISLGDNCVVEAGLYVTAGMKVTVRGEDEVVSARALSGADNLLFRRNSVTGSVEVLQREGAGVELNPELHAQ